MSKKNMAIICPGRGSYTKNELGYLTHRAQQVPGGIEVVKILDHLRSKDKLPTLTELDQAPQFKTRVHTKGEHASALIFACSYLDFLSIDTSKYDIGCVLGNSMGWYISLVVAGALSLEDGYKLIQTMGSMMVEKTIGGQVIYPIINEDWVIQKDKEQLIIDTINKLNLDPHIELHSSIHLGGYEVIGGNKKGIQALLSQLPKAGDYPFQLINHGAFHTPLMTDISRRAFSELPLNEALKFKKPHSILIDGYGNSWKPNTTEIDKLYNYTLDQQVVDTYNFTKSVEVTLKTYAPDKLCLLGPGNSLGGVVGQCIIQNHWKGLNQKSEFQELQKSKGMFLNSIGRDDSKMTII